MPINWNGCIGPRTPHPNFTYVDYSQQQLDPYFTLVASYGWANAMFQSNQGPSFPAHQMLLSGTSAPVPPFDTNGYYRQFVAENPYDTFDSHRDAGNNTGCTAPWVTEVIPWLRASGPEPREWTPNFPFSYPCYEHATLTDLLNGASLSWKFYPHSAGGTVDGAECHSAYVPAEQRYDPGRRLCGI